MVVRIKNAKQLARLRGKKPAAGVAGLEASLAAAPNAVLVVMPVHERHAIAHALRGKRAAAGFHGFLGRRGGWWRAGRQRQQTRPGACSTSSPVSERELLTRHGRMKPATSCRSTAPTLPSGSTVPRARPSISTEWEDHAIKTAHGQFDFSSRWNDQPVQQFGFGEVFRHRCS